MVFFGFLFYTVFALDISQEIFKEQFDL